MKHTFWNMIAAIKNGQMARKLYVLQSKKKKCEALLNIFWDEGFISGYKTSDMDSNTIVIYLKYDNKLPVINFRLVKSFNKFRKLLLDGSCQ